MRSLLALLAAMITWAGLAAPALGEDARTCAGSDLLAGMAKSDPAGHDAVLSGAKAYENAEAILWRVEKDGLKPSHLFGTMHVSDARITKLSATADAALKASSQLVLEVGDLSTGALASAMAASGADLVYADGRSLADQLTAEEFAKVKSVVSAAGMPGEFAGMLKPWLVSTLLSVSDCERRAVAAGAKVLDMQLADRAKAAGIPVAGLESVNEQLAALSGIPEDQQLQMLRVSLNYADRTDDMMETMVQMYLRRDMGAAMPFQLALARQMNIPESAFDGFQTILLVDRNKRMAETAAPILAKGGAFVAVGALHLPGETGLVKLLRAAGYTVTPVE